MRSKFPGHYPPTRPELKALWSKCLFVVDTNVLLDLFRFSDETAADLLAALQGLGDRIWIPHQVALEYHRNLHQALGEEAVQCDKLIKALEDDEIKFTQARKQLIVAPKVREQFRRASLKVKQELTTRRDRLLQALSGGALQNEISELFEGKVGEPFSDADHKAVLAEGTVRYKKQQPPGYKDAKEKGDDPDRLYGDLLLWKQLLRHCEAEKLDAILVTGEHKEDWFLKVNGRTLGPRPELVNEFHQVTGRRAHLYDVPNFLEHAKEQKQAEIKQSSIEEAKVLTTIPHFQPSAFIQSPPYFQQSSILSPTVFAGSAPTIGLRQFVPAVDGRFLTIEGYSPSVLGIANPGSLGVPDSIGPSQFILQRPPEGFEFFTMATQPPVQLGIRLGATVDKQSDEAASHDDDPGDASKE